MTKIIVEYDTEHSGGDFCDNGYGDCCDRLNIDFFLTTNICEMFKTKKGDYRRLRTKKGKPKRCPQCIAAELKAGDK